MGWKFAAWTALQSFFIACPLFAGSSLSWFDQVRFLRFGNEQSVEIDQSVLDLSALKADEYWYVDGQVWFFPGEFLPLEHFQTQAGWEQLQSEKTPLLVTINNSFFQNDKNPAKSNFGTFAIQVKGNRQSKLSFGAYNVYHPARFYKVDAETTTEIRSFGELDSDPARNKQILALCCPINTFEANSDFFLVSHVSSPIAGDVRTPNFSGFFIGPENYLNHHMRTTFALHGVVIGCFFLAGVFYAFIFAFRRKDRSSLFLSLFASLAFLVAAQSFFELPLEAKYINKAWTLLNLFGITCLHLFILEKIKAYLSRSTLKRTYSALAIGSGAGVVSTLFSLHDLSGLIFMALMLSSLVLMISVIVLGLRHRIHGTLYFVAGAIISAIYQYSMIHISLLDLNEDPGNAIALANLAMTFALALVNAKEFSVTYQTSEILRQDLQVLLREIHEKEQARTLFFQNTSHELRTPLNGIIGFMQLLTQNRYGHIPQAAEAQLQKCIRLAISLKNQVNSILDLAKSKKGNLALCNSSISIKDLTSEAEDLATGLLLKRPDFSFQIRCEWQTLLAQFVGDRDKLATILRNLIGNAFKFADPVRPNAVELSLNREGSQLQILVSDTGIGIPLEHQDKIFEEFQQIAGDSRRAYEGSGLGLAIVRDFVKLMGGEIRVESVPGQGSKFFVNIPEQKEIHLQKPAELVTTGLQSSPSVTKIPAVKIPTQKVEQRVRLLVVDDNEMNCEVLRDLLEQDGFEVATVLDGQEALHMMRRERPDLLLLDMMMPYFSGEDVMKAMQADSLLLDIPVILITARASDDDRLFGLSLGADDYLAKPIHHEELLFRVKNILRRLEAKQKSVEAEEGQKLAQLGRLMQDFSHELVMQNQSLYASELLRNILEYTQGNTTGEDASTLMVMEVVARLVQARMQRLGIRMDMSSLDVLVPINQGQLMQVMLNLIANACDAVENLSREDRWIRVGITQQPGKTTISCSNGGPPLTKDFAAAMLQDFASIQGKKGFGLGLGISQRLIKKCQGILEINTQAPHPEVLIVLPSRPYEKMKRSS